METRSCYQFSEEPTRYLSFDSDCTISMVDIDLNDSININKPGENNLDEHDHSGSKSLLNIVQKVEKPVVKVKTPLKGLTRKNLGECNLCSTPSNNDLLKLVDVKRGSDHPRCLDFGLAFLGIENEKHCSFLPPSVLLHEQNKENILTYAEELFDLSGDTFVENTISVPKQNMSIIDSIDEQETVEGIKIKNMCIVGKALDLVNDSTNCCSSNSKITNTDAKREQNETTSILKNDNLVLIEKSLKAEEERTSLLKKLATDQRNVRMTTLIPRIAALTKNKRLTISEPNLITNKPSKIYNLDNKRRSFLPAYKKLTLSIDTEAEIQLLINDMLKMTNLPIETMENNIHKETEILKQQENDHRHSIVSKKRHKSLISSASKRKKPFSFTQRMSVVVKTTLNTPARKNAAHKSSITTIQRKCLIPQTTSEIVTHKSVTKKTPRTKIPRQSCTKVVETLKKPKGKDKMDKLDNIPYTCNICKEKFLIKSLRDTHKRSHENDRPTLLKKLNQCKHCDKKFALLKALHVHLLQNCIKIPPSEKRKLQYTDLNHVEKAQLPNVFRHKNLQKSSRSTISNGFSSESLKKN